MMKHFLQFLYQMFNNLMKYHSSLIRMCCYDITLQKFDEFSQILTQCYVVFQLTEETELIRIEIFFLLMLGTFCSEGY